MAAWVLWLTVTFALLGGACAIVAGTWIGLPAKVALWAPEYRDQEIAWALTLTALLMTPALALAITVVVSYVRYRHEARASAPNRGRVRPSLSGGLILGAQPGDINFRPILQLLLLGLGLLPMALGIVAISGYGAIGMGGVDLLLGAALSGIAAAKLWRDRRNRRAPKAMAVDQAGIHLREPVPFLVPWWAVGMIHADKDSRAGDGLAARVVDIYARQVLPPTKILARLGRRDTSRIFGIENSSILILRINPILDLGLTPESVLDAPNRFRPDDAPVNDRFRIEEGGIRA